MIIVQDVYKRQDYENFNAASAVLDIQGLSIHPGSAKGKMINALLVGMEFHSMLPVEQNPAYTEGYEGFNHLTDMHGECEHAHMSYIIRNHDETLFEQQKEDFKRIADYLNKKYPENTITLQITDSYANMRQIIEQNMNIIELVKKSMEEIGLQDVYKRQDLLDVVIKAGDEKGKALLEKELENGIQEQIGSKTSVDPYKYAVFSWLTKKQLYSVSRVSDAFILHYDEIMNGEFFDELITESSEGKLINALKEFAYRRIYCHSSILKLELMGNEILSFLLDRFVDALLPYDTDIEITEIQKKYIDLLSQNYLEQYHETAKTVKSEEDKVYARLLLATDFIAGMTDSYAKRLYQELRGI